MNPNTNQDAYLDPGEENFEINKQKMNSVLACCEQWNNGNFRCDCLSLYYYANTNGRIGVGNPDDRIDMTKDRVYYGAQPEGDEG